MLFCLRPILRMGKIINLGQSPSLFYKATHLLFLLLLVNFLPAQQIMFLTDKDSNHYTTGQIPLISGQISNPTSSELTLRIYQEYITFKEDVYRAKLHHDGSFAFINVKIKEPTVALLTYNGERVEVYLEPDNQLFTTFDGRNFVPTLAFSGEGSDQNIYLKNALQKFYQYDTKFINHEIRQRGAMEFLSFMNNLKDEKLAFLQEYIEANGEEYSTDFISFANADITYWWAYHLMRYRVEFPASKGISTPSVLPVEYYSFLKQIEISNDEALVNKYYIHFVDAFFAFVKEDPVELQELEGNHTNHITESDCQAILPGPFSFPLIMPIKAGTKIKVAHDSVRTDWQAAITTNKLPLWLPTQTLKLDAPEKKMSSQLATRTVERIRTREELYGEVRFDSLQVRLDPYKKAYITLLKIGDKVDFAYNCTKERISYQQGATTYSDYFCKIKLADGQEGWISRGAVKTKERIVETAEVVEIPVSIAPVVYNNAKKYLSGDALNYTLAKDIYLRASTSTPKQLRKEISDFLEISDSETYNTIAKSAYDHAITGNAPRPKTVALKQLEAGVNLSSLHLEEAYASYLPAHDNISTRTIIKKSVQQPKINPAEYAELNWRLNNNKQAIPTSFSGQLPIKVRKKLELVIYQDPVIFQEAIYLLTPDKEGQFSATFSLTEAVTGELRYGDERLSLFLEPGDNLQVEFTNEIFPKNVQFLGKGSAANTYLKESKIVFQKHQQEMTNKVRYANHTDYQSFMQQARAERQAFMENFSLQKDFSKRFRTFAQADIDYWFGFYSLNYAWEHPLYHDQPAPAKLPIEYYDFTKDLPLNVAGALPNKYYTFYLDQYLALQLDSAKYQGLNEFTAAQQWLEGETFYYYQAKTLVGSCRRGQAKEAGWVIKDFIKDCPYPTYNEVLRNAYHSSKGLLEGTKAPDFALTNIDGETVKLSDYAGKVVFIDFWATWCAPCLRYMRNTQRIKEQFANENVVFLYISLDKDKAVWEDHVRLKNLKGVHLNTGNGSGYESQIAKLYQVKKLPTYVLIDQDGKVAISPDNMPSTGELQGAISRLLTQN